MKLPSMGLSDAHRDDPGSGEWLNKGLDGPASGQRRVISVLAAVAILSPCASYAIVGDAPLIPLLAVVALLPGCWRRRPMVMTTRFVVYAVTLAILSSVVLNQVYPVDGDRFFFPIATELVFPAAITLAIAACLLPQTPFVLASVILISLFAFTLQGATVNDPINTRLPISSPLWRSRYWTFGCFLCVHFAAMLPLLRAAQPGMPANTRHTGRRHRRRRQRAYAAAVLLALAGAAVSAGLTYRYFDVIEAVMLRVFLPSPNRLGVVFPSSVDLNRTLDPKSSRYRHQVVLRARSAMPPGYLRGRVYTEYHRGQWLGRAQERLLPRQADPGLAASVYSRSAADSGPTTALTSMDLFPSADFRSDVLLAPGDGMVFELIAQALTTSPDGVLSARQWDMDGGWSVKAPRFAQDAAYDGPDAPGAQNACLTIPPATASWLRQRSAEAVGDESLPASVRARRVAGWLQNHCDYQLGVHLPSGVDPVVAFVDEVRAGHCELFASAAVLLLRAQGIPARYVTGYVCVRPHPQSGFWLARRGDCHAWAEAYDADAGNWILVEATPAAGLPAEGEDIGWLGCWRERVTSSWLSFYVDVKRGYFARAVIRAFATIWTFIAWLFWHGPWWLGWALLVLLVAGWQIRRRGGPARVDRSMLTTEALKLLLAQLQRYGIRRRVATTVGDLIREVEARSLDVSPALVDCLRRYEALRFRPTPPSNAELAGFQQYVRRVLKTHESNPQKEA